MVLDSSIGYVTRQWRARRVVSLHHLCFSPLQRLTREFKYETFPGQ